MRPRWTPTTGRGRGREHDDVDTTTHDTDEAHTDADWESFTSDDVAGTGSTNGSTTASTTKD